MKKIIILSIAILLIVFSCDIKKEAKLIKIKEIPIESKFVPSLNNSGVFMHKDKEYYFLSDINTFKEVAFYNSKGKKVDSVSLKDVIKKEGTLKGISVHNLDTIFCLSYNNNISSIDNNGEIIRLFNFDNKINYKYTLYSPSYHGFYSDSKMFFDCEPKNLDNNKLDKIELLKYQLEFLYKEPYFICIENVFDTSNIKIKTYLDGYYSKFISSDYRAVESYYISINNNIIYVWSCFNDTITKLNINNNRTTKIRLQSEYSNIVVPPVSIYKNIDISENLRQYGAINRLVYDKYRNVFYVMFLHDTPGNKDGNKYRNFSIAVYDNNFNKLLEKKLNPQKYISYLFVNKDGLVLIKYDKENLTNQSKRKYTYEIYKVDD